MNRTTCIEYYILISAILAVVMIVLWRIAKRQKRSVYWLNFILGVIVVFGLFLYSTMYVYNQAGIRYDEIEWIDGAYKDQVYYTESGQIFYIQNDMLIPVNGVGLSYSLDCSYLNDKGYLVFDPDHSFTQLDVSNEYVLMTYGDSAGVYLSEEYGHVYELRSCSWNLWGNLVTSERKGIKIGNLYLVPFRLMEKYFILKDRILCTVGYNVMAFPAYFALFKLLYVLVKEVKKGTKAGPKDYNACMNFLVFEFAFLDVTAIADYTNSFISFLVGIIISLVCAWYILTFVQGGLRMEYLMEEKVEDLYPKGVTLRDMKEHADPSEVY